MRIKGHGVWICSNHPGAVLNLYTLEKVRPVYHYSSKIHRRLAYLNWIILHSTCLFPMESEPVIHHHSLTTKNRTELLLGHRSQMEQSGLSRNRVQKRAQSGLNVQKKRKQKCFFFFYVFNCYSLALESQKSKGINSESVLGELFYSIFSDFPRPVSVASVNFVRAQTSLDHEQKRPLFHDWPSVFLVWIFTLVTEAKYVFNHILTVETGFFFDIVALFNLFSTS